MPSAHTQVLQLPPQTGVTLSSDQQRLIAGLVKLGVEFELEPYGSELRVIPLPKQSLQSDNGAGVFNSSQGSIKDEVASPNNPSFSKNVSQPDQQVSKPSEFRYASQEPTERGGVESEAEDDYFPESGWCYDLLS